MPLLAAHHGVVGPALSPHPLTSDASVAAADIAVESDTREWTVKIFACTCAFAAPATQVTSAIAQMATSDLSDLIGIPLLRGFLW